MQRQWTESSAPSSVGYEQLGGILEVQFAHGGVYSFFGVPADAVEAFMAAGSHGSHFG